ncbi:MAG: response regulator [Candidatus Hodarchaeales archaeon]
MKPTILVVEDNKQIMLNLKLFLKLNEFQTLQAFNGREALEILSKLTEPPDLILSDIMMPEMDGYELFQTVSENPKWFHVPFIFLTAKSDPEDIRFGKKLGVDDYIIKPFDNDDLLASINGRIKRNKKLNSFSEKIEKSLLTSLKIDTEPSLSSKDVEKLFLLYIEWDESFGPKMIAIYPEKSNSSLNFDIIAIQLFQTTVSVYGQTTGDDPQGLLLKISNIKRDGYIYFDTYIDDQVRGGNRQFMVAIIAPKINYLESLRLEEISKEVANIIKKKINWNIEEYWKKVVKLLTQQTSRF